MWGVLLEMIIVQNKPCFPNLNTSYPVIPGSINNGKPIPLIL
jgi:hypothetical protein